MSIGDKKLYCPRCGTRAFQKTAENFLCLECGFTFYFNVAAAVGGIIESEKGILFVLRKNEPKRGMLDLPGGFVDDFETAESALIREVQEELNIRITNTEYICTQPNSYTYKGINYQTLDIFYKCYPENLDSIIPRDDVSGFSFIPRGSVELDKLAFDSHREAINIYRKIY